MGYRTLCVNRVCIKYYSIVLQHYIVLNLVLSYPIRGHQAATAGEHKKERWEEQKHYEELEEEKKKEIEGEEEEKEKETVKGEGDSTRAEAGTEPPTN